jgi:hypothetical protein
MAPEIQFKSASYLTESSGVYPQSLQVTQLEPMSGQLHETKHGELKSVIQSITISNFVMGTKHPKIIYLLHFNTFRLGLKI